MTVETIAPAPKILHEGRYRLYEKSDGTIRIQYKRDDKDIEDFMEIPGSILTIAKAASEGRLTPTQIMGEMMKLMNGQGK